MGQNFYPTLSSQRSQLESVQVAAVLPFQCWLPSQTQGTGEQDVHQQSETENTEISR